MCKDRGSISLKRHCQVPFDNGFSVICNICTLYSDVLVHLMYGIQLYQTFLEISFNLFLSSSQERSMYFTGVNLSISI